MALPRIPPPPPPPPSGTATPPPLPTQLGHGDLLASFDDETPQVRADNGNPHLQLYNGPTADFSAPMASSPVSQTHHEPPPPPPQHIRHPLRRLSQIFSSLGPASPPVVSEQAGNGFILPPHHHHHHHTHSSIPTSLSAGKNNDNDNDEFGAFTSASPAAAGEATEGKPGPTTAHRRLSSFEGLWNLVPGSVSTFPRRASGSGSAADRSSTVRNEDVVQQDSRNEGAQSQSPSRSASGSGSGSGFAGLSDLLRSRSRDPTPAPHPSNTPGGSGSGGTNILGTTLKAASKWKTIRGPSSFHPIPSSSFTEEGPPPPPPPQTRTSGYALRHPFIEDADDFTALAAAGGRPVTAKPFVITHASPFAPSTSTSVSSSSFSPPRFNRAGLPVLLGSGAVSGAPGFRREDDYLGSTRPVASTYDDPRPGLAAGATTGAGAGGRAGKQNGMRNGVQPGNENDDGSEKSGMMGTDTQQNGNAVAGAGGAEWAGTKLVGRKEGTDVVLDQPAADAVSPVKVSGGSTIFVHPVRLDV